MHINLPREVYTRIRGRNRFVAYSIKWFILLSNHGSHTTRHKLKIHNPKCFKMSYRSILRSFWQKIVVSNTFQHLTHVTLMQIWSYMKCRIHIKFIACIYYWYLLLSFKNFVIKYFIMICLYLRFDDTFLFRIKNSDWFCE